MSAAPAAPAAAASTISPRLNNKEPFRPVTRAAKERCRSDDTVMPSHGSLEGAERHSPGSAFALPQSPPAHPTSPPLHHRLAEAPTPTPLASVVARSLQTGPAPRHPHRPASPIKLSAPTLARAALDQYPAAVSRASYLPRPATPTTPVTPSTSRPASPLKVRAKVTEGVASPQRKRPKGAPPPVPNVVRHGGSPQHTVPSQDADTSLVDGGECHGDDSFLAHTSDPDRTDTVTVHLRLRPLPPTEPSAWVSSPATSSVALQPALAAGRSSGAGTHTFDAVHLGSSNGPLYKTLARPLVASVLSGFNALIFAYGQTASGKTFTLSGDDKSRAEGITQKAVRDLFRGIRSSNREREWLVRCSWIEVYNEGVKDLLEPSNVPQIRSSTTRGTFVSPLAEVIVTSPTHIFELLEKGQKNRHVNATDWNERSSRSHTAFKIIVESWARDCDDVDPSPDARKKVRVSELVLVDLAGSEKYVTKGGKERRAEGANINKSLLTLGKVIFALSEKPPGSSAGGSGGGGASTAHIPYRDSKLTRILQNSLSGNSKIAVVATLNQAVASVEESLSTINFAKRIKKVKLSARRNEVDAPESSEEAQALLVKYRNEADALRKLVQELQEREQERAAAGAHADDSSCAAAAVAAVHDEAIEGRIEELEERLQEIGCLVVRGEGEGRGGAAAGDDVDSDVDVDVDEGGAAFASASAFGGLDSPAATPARGDAPPPPPLLPSMPGTPTQVPTHLDFTLPPSALRRELHAAQVRIASLQAELQSGGAAVSSGASSSSRSGSAEDAALIADLRKQLDEAGIALDASAREPLPKIREDVVAEYEPRIKALEAELAQSRTLYAECMRECERLQRVNQRLVALAHRETSELVGRLRQERAASPVKKGSGSAGGSHSPLTTPTVRRLRGDVPATVGRPRPRSYLGELGMSDRKNGNGNSGGNGINAASLFFGAGTGLGLRDGEDDACRAAHGGAPTPTPTPTPATPGFTVSSPSPSPLKGEAARRRGGGGHDDEAEEGDTLGAAARAAAAPPPRRRGVRRSISHDFGLAALGGSGGNGNGNGSHGARRGRAAVAVAVAVAVRPRASDEENSFDFGSGGGGGAWENLEADESALVELY